MDENGNLNEKVILEKGKEMMLSQISELQQGIELTEFQINSIEENQKYSGQNGIYSRRIKERYLIETPFNGDFGALHEKEMAGNHAYPRNRGFVQAAGHNTGDGSFGNPAKGF